MLPGELLSLSDKGANFNINVADVSFTCRRCCCSENRYVLCSDGKDVNNLTSVSLT